MSQISARHDLQEVLQTVADGVVDVVGFQVTAISYLRPDQTLEVVAVSGSDEARTQLLGRRSPVGDLDVEFAVAEEWGILRFVPHERIPADVSTGWIPDVQPLQVPNAWHPEDALLAPLRSPTGDLVGLLSVDLPEDGLRPGQFQRDVLEMYAVQAGIAINNAQQRTRLAEQVRLASAVRSIMDTAGRGLDLGRVIDDSVRPVVSGLRCHGMWIRAFQGEGELPGRGRGAIFPADPRLVPSDEILAFATRAARRCWTEQRALIVTEEGSSPAGLLSPDEVRTLFDFVGQAGTRALLCVPMGAGHECLGYLVLTRTAEGPDWSEEEAGAALEIGRELGRAVLHARLFEREREVVSELQDLDRYKTDLIATISHELKNPLTSIIGHLELVRTPGAEATAEKSLAAIARNAERLDTLVENLLLLSKMGDPNRPLIPMPVDMTALLREIVEMFNVQAEQRGVKIELNHGEGPVTAWGDRAEIDRAVSNIVSNAIKFTPEGGAITLTLAADDRQVTFACRDDGLGISPADQEQLFTEFFRSSNPGALAVPGTGLGLTIVKRIVTRHVGTISVDSEIGSGSTFTVTLPAAPQTVIA
jgi:signal transduction histidine kinase